MRISCYFDMSYVITFDIWEVRIMSYNNGYISNDSTAYHEKVLQLFRNNFKSLIIPTSSISEILMVSYSLQWPRKWNSRSFYNFSFIKFVCYLAKLFEKSIAEKQVFELLGFAAGKKRHHPRTEAQGRCCWTFLCLWKFKNNKGLRFKETCLIFMPAYLVIVCFKPPTHGKVNKNKKEHFPGKMKTNLKDLRGHNYSIWCTSTTTLLEVLL